MILMISNIYDIYIKKNKNKYRYISYTTVTLDKNVMQAQHTFIFIIVLARVLPHIIYIANLPTGFLSLNFITFYLLYL
jgi:hypothetical protein